MYAKKTITILQATNDGNILSPPDLLLVQDMVNASVFGVSEEMEAAFDALYQNVIRGYRPPWFHGVENLTIDHQGYIYWRGHEIEHFNMSYAYTERAKQACIELERRCKILEAAGNPVNTTSVIWKWENN